MTPGAIFRIFRGAFALYGVAYLALGLVWPSTFLKTMSVETSRSKLRANTKIVLTLIGVGVICYGASWMIASAIPAHFATMDLSDTWDDDEPTTLRMSVVWGLTCWGALGLVAGAELGAKSREPQQGSRG